MSGAASGTLHGFHTSERLVLDVSGASTVALSAYPLLNADVTLSGGSHATINLTGLLNADVSDASHLTYLGDPTLGDIVTRGGSTVTGP